MRIEEALRECGASIVALLTFIGECVTILAHVAGRALTSKFELAETIEQMAFVGNGSVPVIVATCFCSGAVFSLYSTKLLVMYRAGDFVGATVGLAVTRELGPVIVGITVAARAGSAMAAQIATMAVTEQLDAMRMLSVHPITYLVIPRVLATLIMLPMLTLFGDCAGGIGSQLVAAAGNVPPSMFLSSIQQLSIRGTFLEGF